MFATLSIRPVLITQGRKTSFLRLYTFTLFERVTDSPSTNLAVLVEPAKSDVVVSKYHTSHRWAHT